MTDREHRIDTGSPEERGFVVKFFTAQEISDMQCPVCGYYCLGKGGFGCIDKLAMYEAEKKRSATP